MSAEDARSRSCALIPWTRPAAGAQKTPGMVELPRGAGPIVWAGDGPLRLTTVMVDGVERPGASALETGLLREGQVLD